MPFDKSKYDMEYAKEHVTRKFIAFNNNDPQDKELLTYLNAKGKGNVNAFIKQLVLQDMHRSVNPCRYPPTRYSDELFGCPVCHHEVTPGMDACYRCGVFLEWAKHDET